MSIDPKELADIRHAAPGANPDNHFFYAGLELRRLLVQQCSGCGKLRNPPSPMCTDCGSFDWSAQDLAGHGTVFSYVVHHHPPLPTFDTPHPVVLAEMAEGIRLVGALRENDREDLAIGKPVRVEFLRRDKVATFRFALVRENDR